MSIKKNVAYLFLRGCFYNNNYDEGTMYYNVEALGIKIKCFMNF